MTRKTRSAPARPIKNKRDYVGASAVVKRLSGQAEKDTDAERRLQSLLKALDKFDEEQDEEDGVEAPGEFDYDGPKRRWTDD